jgi:hypothetical protein
MRRADRPSPRQTLAAIASAPFLIQPAFAAHPFITEDPGTQGTGRIELELGLAASQGDPSLNGRAVAFSPQLSLGIAPAIDLIAQAVWLNQMPTRARANRARALTSASSRWH